MNLQLKQKRAVVTGSSSGIGEAIATALGAEGAHVLLHGRREAALEQVAEAIPDRGGHAAWVSADLTTDHGAQTVIDVATAELGGVDILINNAGTYDFHTSWASLTPNDWNERFNENTLSAVRLIKLTLPHMKEAGWGRIINVSSTAVQMPPSELPDYSASKAALANLTLSLARDCARTGVTANSISPGIVLTSGMWSYLHQLARQNQWQSDDAAIADMALKEVFDDPPGGWGHPADIAYVALFLASPHAHWINGSDLRVDGGEAATG